MTRRIGVVVAWLVATIVAIGVAATAVGSVRGQVTDIPVIPAADTAALLVTTTTAPVETTTVTIPATTTTTATEATTPPTTTQPTTTTTTTTTAPQSTTTTTDPASPTTTTTVTGPQVKTYQLIGGQVTISAFEPTVTLVGATPTPGFSGEVEASGPDEVEVEFESADHKSSFRARWEDGRLGVDIDEESEDGD